MNAPGKHADFIVAHRRHAPKAPPADTRLPVWDDVPAEFLILLLPGFSQLCLSSLVDPLWLANSLSRRELFRWRLVSADGKSVESASGVCVEVSGSVTGEVRPHQGGSHACSVVVCAGEGVERHNSDSVRAFLRGCVRSHMPVYALGTATWLLADAGLLGNSRCTIHWGKMAALSEIYYDLDIDDALFVRDGQFTTCAGELAAFDLAVDLIHARCSVELIRDICQHLTADRWRDGASCQSVPPGLRYAGSAKKLVRILQLMEKNIEEPLPLEEIARRVALSRRQIERLFEQHLSTTPWQHYLGLRLARARQLIELTKMPIMNVAVACGFASAAGFSKNFRDHFKTSPSRMRKTAAGRNG
jgi:transcriptional regulator GlxA family with amidase domain